jgi:hypothetical protein
MRNQAKAIYSRHSQTMLTSRRAVTLIKVREDNVKRILAKICFVTFKRNNISDRCYRDEEEANTRGPFAPYIQRPSVFFSPLATALSFRSPTSFSSSPLSIV